MNYMIKAEALRERLVNIDPDCALKCSYDEYERALVEGTFMKVTGIYIVVGPFDACGAPGYEVQAHRSEYDFCTTEITESADKALVNLGAMIEWANSYREVMLVEG